MSCTPSWAQPRVLVAGWSSVLHGEATAGDVLAAAAVCERLRAAGIAHDTAWSPAMHLAYGDPATEPLLAGALLDAVDPRAYTHLVFVCGPLTGAPVEELVAAFGHAQRIAVGVSVLDRDDPAVRGFHHVLARDAPGAPPQRDLAARPPAAALPLVGVFLTPGQGEYTDRRRHGAVTTALGAWLARQRCARLELETRLDPRDWRLPATPEQVLATVGRLDAVVTTRLHGLVLALRAGVPAVAVDPVAGGGKVTAQARAWDWPALVGAEALLAGGGDRLLDRHLAWALGPAGRAAAGARGEAAPAAGQASLDALVSLLQV
ncbi:MAG: polysaccharide pyruvyl transferase [Mycobacterium sp.]|nr:polysaccharide pyruvyl transferase [Mycobacterium sp.]